jgi:hypothetical protein
MGRKRSGQPRSVRHTVAGRSGRHLEQLAAAGLTTAELACKAGVTEDAIDKYFRGTNVRRLDGWHRRAPGDADVVSSHVDERHIWWFDFCRGSIVS